MGMDPDAHLWYGVACETGENPFAPKTPEGDTDWEAVEQLERKLGIDYDLGTWLARKEGVVNPYEAAPDHDPEYSEWKANFPDLDGAYKRWSERCRELGEEAPVEVINLGSADADPWFGIAVKGMAFRSDWNAADEVRFPALVPHHELMERVRAFCAEHGLPFEDPKWLLTASYR